ncbi:hypothetical protein Krac_6648 [Ktedonobacter racemifer DSM 44963]|uniref:Uncharacterized protein n=1 Tax=Ktedonobacter racemifer DSM 44963 TaxID=485913 RepID=D6TNB5_KTERA|nr:hypothetical protein Krac_6648 [Ktedonobacter racemifer DSM 44963]
MGHLSIALPFTNAAPDPAKRRVRVHLVCVVFCHSSVKYGEECPAWVFDEKYALVEPWFFHPKEEVRKWDMETTPEEFARRKIYCGGRVFVDKWELDEEIAKIKQFRQQSTQKIS